MQESESEREDAKASRHSMQQQRLHWNIDMTEAIALLKSSEALAEDEPGSMRRSHVEEANTALPL